MSKPTTRKTNGKASGNYQSTKDIRRRKSAKRFTQLSSCDVNRRGLLRAFSKTSLGIDNSLNKTNLSNEPKPVDHILCIDESIIESSPKPILEGFLRYLRLPYRGLTKSKLQLSLRQYLQQRNKQCLLPATLLKRAKFWRVAVVRKTMSSQNKMTNPPKATFLVRTEWGSLGRKRFGRRQTPKKIIPTPTKNQTWESKVYSSKERAEKVARSKIRHKLNTGYYLSTEGSLPWCETGEKSAPALVRSDSNRTLKFANVLKMREFEQDRPVMTYTQIKEAPKVNFLSDNEL
jgi:hypothetical protein